MKMASKFFCVLLTVAMLLTSTFAMAEAAETVTVSTLTLSDFDFSVNDESLVDLSGLGVSIGGGITEDGSKGLLQLAVLAGDDAAASAQLATSDGKGVLTVPGMSKSLSVDMKANLDPEVLKPMLVEALNIGDDEEKKAALDDLFVKAPEVVSEENIMAMMAAFGTYTEEIEGIMAGVVGEPRAAEASEYVFSDTTEAATAIPFAVTSEQMNSVMMGAYGFYDANPALLAVFNDIMILDDEKPMTSFSDFMAENLEEAKVAMDGCAYTNEDGSAVAVTANIVNEASEEDNSVYMNVEAMVGETIEVTMYISPNNGTDDSMLMSMSIDPASSAFNMDMLVNNEGESTYMSMSSGTDDTMGQVFQMTIDNNGQTFSISAASGDYGWVVSAYDDSNVIECGYNKNEDDLVYFSMTSGEDKISVTAHANVTTSTISADEIDALMAVETIDVSESISDEDMQTLMGEASGVAMQALMTLMQNVPGIAQLAGAAE